MMENVKERSKQAVVFFSSKPLGGGSGDQFHKNPGFLQDPDVLLSWWISQGKTEEEEGSSSESDEVLSVPSGFAISLLMFSFVNI